MGISSVVVVDDDDVKAVSEQGFLKTKDGLLFGEEGNIDCCCLVGDDGFVFIGNVVVVVVDEDDIGDDGGDNFISARFLFTPCSTGSNSSERLRDATASMIAIDQEERQMMKTRRRS